MKIIVLGSGVIGVTSAWYLAKAGHEVVVVDRQPGPALETSFGNAGEISPGYASPWAAPGIPLKAIKWLAMEHAPLILRPPLDMATARWLYAMLRNCSAERYAVNKERMVRVAEWSRDCLIALRAETGIRYDERMQGTLQLFREQAQLDGIAKDVAVLAAGNVPFEILDRAECLAAEPGLANSAATIIGGLRLPNDETGDCFKFTDALATLAADAGVTFRYDCRIERLLSEGGIVSGVQTDQGVLTADAYLLALGSFSPALAAPLGLRLPVYPVKGYSITVPITDAARAPVSTLLDESYKVAITRLGDRIRVGGMAAISGFNTSLPPRPRRTLEFSVGSLFPGAGDLAAASYWTGLRPMTPDSTPIIGPTRLRNLFLNTGHGTLGWTMACGSGQVIADLMSGRAPEIDTRDLALSRY
jgi:D-amino-acid dehydrogenase